MRALLHAIGMALLALGFHHCASRTDADNPSPPLSPQEELATFKVEGGLKVTLVASEPMVQDPVVIAFDEDGRLWVVEMRGFMPDIDGLGEKKRVGRISILEDADNDGAMDRSTVYIDSLLMPRALAVINGGALIVEDQSLWLTQDINHDLRADTKILVDAAYAGNAFPEHSGNGLWRGIDNWYYNAKSRFRYRLVEGEWIRDSTEFRGQWGICHDDEGRLIYNYNWSQLHADLVPPNYFSANRNHVPTTGIDHGLTIDRRIYPARPNPAVNRGYIPGTLDDQGRLLEFTSACSPLYYRGQTLPQDFYGNVFVCEPSGNLIKRNVVTEKSVWLSAHDPHPGREFFASTDERCRPVFLATGPDGALYFADMYRGLIQHGAYVTPYLRDQTLKRNLVQPVNLGRIWRIVSSDWQPAQPERLSNATTEELVNQLSNPDGWHRDMAQRLLVERNDPQVVANLVRLASHGEGDLGRLHALWTLEGMGQLDPEHLFSLLGEKSELISATALRLIEPFVKKDAALRMRVEKMLLGAPSSGSARRDLMAALAARSMGRNASLELLLRIAERYDSSAIFRDAILSSLAGRELSLLTTIMSSPGWQEHSPAREIFIEMLTSATIRGQGAAGLKSLMAILDEAETGWREKAIVTSMVIQGGSGKAPVALKSAPGILANNGTITPAQKEILGSMFEWPGHKVNVTTVPGTRLTDAERRQFATGRQHYLSTCATCHGTDGAGLTRFAPTLIGSEWVLGDERRLALIVLHGIEGPLDVAGKTYDVPEILPVMPAHSTMDDSAITSLLIYIRNEWGNKAGPVSRRTVGTTRHTTQGRVTPWTAAELNQHVLELKPYDEE